MSEAEEVVEKIRARLAKEKRNVSPKPFEFWIDGQLAVISQVYFEKKESLEKQLEKTILTFDSWDEDIRYKYVNALKEYAEEERQLFLNREFHAFAVRYDQLFGLSSYEPFAIKLDIKHLNQLYIAIQKHVTTGFYSELEKIMGAIRIGIAKVVADADQREHVQKQTDFLKQKQVLEDEVLGILHAEETYRIFIQYVAACFQSVSSNRIDAMCPHFKPYQHLQQELFKHVARQISFSKAYDMHVSLKKELMVKFDAILAQGFALTTDEMVESLVLSPVIQSTIDDVKILLKSEVKEGEGEAIPDLS
ncbi:MAG: hypothetical protein RR595_09470 [Lysinibacillus sp.]